MDLVGGSPKTTGRAGVTGTATVVFSQDIAVGDDDSWTRPRPPVGFALSDDGAPLQPRRTMAPGLRANPFRVRILFACI